MVSNLNAKNRESSTSKKPNDLKPISLDIVPSMQDGHHVNQTGKVDDYLIDTTNILDGEKKGLLRTKEF